MKRVLSPSLGSPQGDYDVTGEFLGQAVRVQRIGTASSRRRFVEILRSERDTVDCFGFGGGDIYVVAGGCRYRWRYEYRMALEAGDTPIVDGSGLKNTIERRTIEWLVAEGVVDFAHSRTLIVSAVDRFGMAEAIARQGGETIMGDLIFSLGVPVPLRSERALALVARTFLPVITQCPQSWFYPTGAKQEAIAPRYPRFYEWADTICGDFQYIRRYLAQNLMGKTIITNTTKPDDLQLLRERGVRRLVTSTPDLTLGGRSPGTNVLEALVVALLERRPGDITADDYMATLGAMDWEPRVVDL
jgi:hypothetical protein